MNLKKFFDKYFAFTLGEVLIAVTIIGILAVLTIPTMVVNVHKHEYKSGVKKAHSLISESFDSMKIDENYIYGTYNNSNVPADAFRKAYAIYFGLKHAGYGADHYQTFYHPLNNNNTGVNAAVYNGGGFKARNGMEVLIGKVPKPDNASKTAMVISVDIDGPNKGENQLGLDIFSFEVMPSDNILPMGAKSTLENTTSFDSTTYCKTPYSGDDLNGIACTYSAVNQAEYMDDVVAASDPTGCAGKLNGLGSWDAANNTFVCSGGKEPDFNNCTCNCPKGTTATDNGRCRDNDKNCIKQDDGSCECENGVKMVDDVCSPDACDEDKHYFKIDGKDGCTYCKAGLNADSNGCAQEECPTEQEWVAIKNSCQDKCVVGMSRAADTGECVCDSGMTTIGGIFCCPNTDGNNLQLLVDASSNGNCVYDCGAGTYKSSGCECNKGATIGGGKDKCECNQEEGFVQESNSTRCVCEPGRKLVGSYCVCENGSSHDDCGCAEENGLISGSESNTCTCDVNSNFKATGNVKPDYQCVCAGDHMKIVVPTGGGKASCECVGKGRSMTARQEGCACNENEYWKDGGGDDCECDTFNGFTLSSDGNSCECQGNITTKYGKAYCEQTCKNGAVYNKAKGGCECTLANAEISGDSCVCLVEGMSIVTKNGRYNCECPPNWTVDYNVPDKPNGVCISGGSLQCNGWGQKLETGCVCQDGTQKAVSAQEDAELYASQQEQLSKFNENFGDSNTNFENLQCYCPDGYEISGENITYKAENGYHPLFCEKNSCTSTNGIWISEGGLYGSCECGSAKGIVVRNDSCTCQGDDAYVSNDSIEGNKCTCTEPGGKSKLKYDVTKRTCVPYNEDDEKDLNYYINDKDELLALNGDIPLLGAYNYVLTDDVEISDNWTPWGTPDAPFKGNFDGQGHTITIKKDIGNSDTDYVGFFGYASNSDGSCNIKNLNLVVEGDVIGKNYVGALVGFNNCTIENVTVSAKNVGIKTPAPKEGSTLKTYSSTVGGIIGLNTGKVANTNITNGQIYGVESLGGAIGENDEGGYVESCAVQNVKVNSYTTEQSPTQSRILGGFVGKNVGQISKSFVDNNVTVGSFENKSGVFSYYGQRVGGFVGQQGNDVLTSSASISNSYTKAKIIANNLAGGFVGEIQSGTLTYVYTNSDMTVTTGSGKFMGNFYGSNKINIQNSLYLSDKTDKSDADGNGGRCKNYGDTCKYLFPKNENQLKDPATYLCLGWLDGKGKETWYFPTNGTTGTTIKKYNFEYPQLLNSQGCMMGGFKFDDDECKVCSNFNEYYISEKKDDLTNVGCLAMNATIGDTCSADVCGEGEHYDSVQKTCVAGCPNEGETWKSDINKCVCPAGMIVPPGRHACQCNTAEHYAFYEAYGCIKCESIPNGKWLDDGSNKCGCNDGYKFDEIGPTCIKQECSKTQSIDDGKGGCAKPKTLKWNSDETKMVCNDASFMDIENDTDLYYLSVCSQDKKFEGGSDLSNDNYYNWTDGKTYNLTSDIDMSAYSYTPTKTNYIFAPIADFKGIFNGNQKTISNISIIKPDEDNVGFISKMTASDTCYFDMGLYFRNINIQGNNNVGGLVGLYSDLSAGSLPSILNVTILNDDTCSISGKNYVGGVIGQIDKTSTNAKMKLSFIGYKGHLNLLSDDGYIGGIIGYLNDNTSSSSKYFLLSSSFSQPIFNKNIHTGGIIGTLLNIDKYYDVGKTTDTNYYQNCDVYWLGDGKSDVADFENVAKRTSNGTISAHGYTPTDYTCPAI